MTSNTMHDDGYRDESGSLGYLWTGESIFEVIENHIDWNLYNQSPKSKQIAGEKSDVEMKSSEDPSAAPGSSGPSGASGSTSRPSASTSTPGASQRASLEE